MAEAESNNIDVSPNRKSLDGIDTEVYCRNAHASDAETSKKMTNAEKNDGYVVDIDKWASSLAEMLEDIPQYMCIPGHPGRISRIPENIREIDAKSYEPYFLSIGPYHHHNPRVQRMEIRKRIVLKCFLERNSQISLKDYLSEIMSIESAAKSFYSEVEMEREKFIQMLLLDSLYVVIVLCEMAKCRERSIHPSSGDDDDNSEMILREDESCNGSGENDNSVGGPSWFGALLSHDILLLENQLPLFVLEKMYGLVYGGPKAEFMNILKHILGDMLLDYTKRDSEMVIPQTEEVYHLLHLAHLFFRPTVQPESTSTDLVESGQMFRLGNTVQLYEAGVRFEARWNSTQHSLLDVTFSSGKMIIPCLNVDDNTVSLLRNLIALEQMKYPSLGLNVSAYAVLLLHLVTIPEDVALLRRKGIIQHHLSSDKEMMYLVNRLSVGLSFDYVGDEYSLKPVFRELKRYTEHRVPGWRAWLRHKYFHNPWTVISLLAASLLLLLTFIQTFYAVYPYWRPWL